MHCLITLDYELFFGAASGSPEKCLVDPTDALMKAAGRHGARLTFFVDTGYLVRLREEERKSAWISRHRRIVLNHLESVVGAGHDLQLHIHPHWHDSQPATDQETWSFDISRYRLPEFDRQTIHEIVQTHTRELAELRGSPPTAYRAGGWSCQPFDRLAGALSAAGITIDSTVYAGGHQSGQCQRFDFRNAPDGDHWRFDVDPCVPSPSGEFIELPIASIKISPCFHQRMAARRILGTSKNRVAFGDGSPIFPERGDLLRKLTRHTRAASSIDGMKINLFERSLEAALVKSRRYFVTIGHPKALSPYSIARLSKALERNRRSINFSSMQEVADQISKKTDVCDE